MHIAIIGGSHATFALLPRISSSHKITVIDPSPHYIWHPAGVRSIVDPDTLERQFTSLKAQLARYPNVTLVPFRVDSVDAASKTLSLSNSDRLSYDILVVASGSSTISPEWKSTPSTATDVSNKDRLKAFNSVIPNAQTIVVGGAGPIGIETCAEIKYKFPKKRVVLICSDESLLAPPKWASSLGPKALSQLKSLGVEVIFNSRVTSPIESSLSPVAVQLTQGSPIQTDVYVSAIGSKSNADFLAKEFKDDQGWVKTTSTMQSVLDPNIFVIGDAANFLRKFAAVLADQAKIVGYNINKYTENPLAKLHEYTTNSTIVGVITIGPKGGVGQYSFMKFPSFMVAFVKGKDLLLNMAPKPVEI